MLCRLLKSFSPTLGRLARVLVHFGEGVVRHSQLHFPGSGKRQKHAENIQLLASKKLLDRLIDKKKRINRL